MSCSAMNLSCLSSVKARTRVSSRRFRESTTSESLLLGRHGGKRTSNTGNPNRLYDIEMLEEDEYRVKIHYVGYSSQYDEWIRKSEIRYKPGSPLEARHDDHEQSLDDSSLVFSALGSFIKQKLVPSGGKDDPAVRIQLPCAHETFQLLKRRGRSLGKSRARNTYTISNYCDLNSLLGEGWHLRVTNTNGDFCHVILETIRFYMMRPRPLLDFEARGRTAEDMELVPFYTEQPTALVFQFVKKDGNRRQLVAFTNR